MPFGYKGYSLGVMVEMLMRQLSHARCTKQDGEDGSEVIVLAINIENFTGIDDYEREVEQMAEWVYSTRPPPGFDKIYASDETAQATKARLRLGGIDLPPEVWDEIGSSPRN